MCVCVCMCALRLLNSRCGMRLIDLVLNAKINIIFLQQQHQMKRDVVVVAAVVVVKRGKEQSKQARQNENMFKVFYYLSFGSDLSPLSFFPSLSFPFSWRVSSS